LDPDDLLDKTALEKLAFVGTELISNQPKETFFSIKIGFFLSFFLFIICFFLTNE